MSLTILEPEEIKMKRAMFVFGLLLSFGISAENIPQSFGGTGQPIVKEATAEWPDPDPEMDKYLDFDPDYSQNPQAEIRREQQENATHDELEIDFPTKRQNISEWYGESGIIYLRNNKLITPWGALTSQMENQEKMQAG